MKYPGYKDNPGLTEARMQELKGFTRQYPEFKQALAETTFISAVNQDGQPSGSGVSNPTANLAERHGELLSKVWMIESCAKAALPDDWEGLLIGLVNMTPPDKLKASGKLHCGYVKYYQARATYYKLLDERRK